MTPSGGFVAEPSPGFTPTRLRFPFGVRIGLPLCVRRTLPLPADPRKPDRWFVFANCKYFSRGQSSPACPPFRGDTRRAPARIEGGLRACEPGTREPPARHERQRSRHAKDYKQENHREISPATLAGSHSPLKGQRAKPRGSSTVVSPSRGLLRSDNVTPVRVSAVSHLVPGCPLSPEAEASFDPRPHLGAEAPRCAPVQNRDSVQVGDPPGGFSPVTS